jgi:hypothetical protein
MEANLSKLIESGKTDLVKRTVDQVITINQQEFMYGAITGKALIPTREDAQFLMLAAEYSRIASKNPDPMKKLWQFTFALAATQKSGSKNMNYPCWEEIQREFPNLSEPVRDYLKQYIGVD